jgi:hypothetical protein
MLKKLLMLFFVLTLVTACGGGGGEPADESYEVVENQNQADVENEEVE